MRRMLTTALSLLLAQSFATAAHATLEVRLTPHPIRQCGQAHFFASMDNGSSEPLEVDVTATLENRGRVVARMLVGHFVIAAGATYVEEFDFVMPYISLGSYVVTLNALMADGSSMEGSTRFTVCAAARDSNCFPTTPQDLLSILAANLADEPQGTSSRPRGRQDSIMSSKGIDWQDCKVLYR